MNVAIISLVWGVLAAMAAMAACKPSLRAWRLAQVVTVSWLCWGAFPLLGKLP